MDNNELDKFLHTLVRQYVDAEHTFLDLVFEMGDQEDMTKEDAKNFIEG